MFPVFKFTRLRSAMPSVYAVERCFLGIGTEQRAGLLGKCRSRSTIVEQAQSRLCKTGPAWGLRWPCESLLPESADYAGPEIELRQADLGLF